VDSFFSFWKNPCWTSPIPEIPIPTMSDAGMTV
jgi:hypothetical protein